MSYALEGYYSDTPVAANAMASERTAFIRRTYMHLAGAILAFTGIEYAIFKLLPTQVLMNILGLFFHPASFLIVFVAFIGVGYLARMWAFSGASQATQYLGLALYVLLEAIIFIPIMAVCLLSPSLKEANILPNAAIMTLSMFAGLTLAVFTTRKDFSFLGPILSVACMLMFGLCIAAMFFGPQMGLFYSFIGVALACAYILYDTSNVLHHFRTDQHVAAALELFCSIAYLFMNIVRIMILTSRNN